MTDQPIIHVRPLESIEDFTEAEELQRQVWPGSELDVVPLHVLTILAHNGGLVLGAFHGDRMVGMLLLIVMLSQPRISDVVFRTPLRAAVSGTLHLFGLGAPEGL